MDRADLRKTLIKLADNLIARTWTVDAETRRICRAARKTAEENDAWVDTLLETVNKTYGEEVPESKEAEALPTDKPTLVALATDIGGNLKAVGYQFSPLIIIAILGALIQLFQACRQTPERAAKRAANPRLLDRIALRRVIREHAGDENADALEAALLDAGNTITTAEMKKVYKEVSPA